MNGYNYVKMWYCFTNIYPTHFAASVNSSDNSCVTTLASFMVKIPRTLAYRVWENASEILSENETNLTHGR